KMSKSLGNSPDLLDLIDNYGADAVRFGIMISSPAGNDLLFDEASLEQGKFFNNKIWNALKLVKSWELRVGSQGSAERNFAIDWFENRLNEIKGLVETQYKEFRLSEALKTIYSLIWDDFCSWYLEWAKPGFEQPIEKVVYEKTVYFFEELMQLLHPFMPFVTEEIYHQIKERADGDDLCIKQHSNIQNPKPEILIQGSLLKEVITSLRDARNKNQLKLKDTINLHILTNTRQTYIPIESILLKQVNATSMTFTDTPVANSITVVVQKDKFFIETTATLDTTSQKEQLQKDLDYLKGFLQSVEKKLSNEKFVNNAKPEIIETERKKKADAESKIKAIEESLASL
ncbi:MAG: class I tRNA ligase family protein, partial [Bacteroidota bacterium]